jgi:transposase
VREVVDMLKDYNLDLGTVRQRMYRASTDRERERWHAIWLIAHGWTQTEVAEALERDKHTIGEWVSCLDREGPQGLAFEHTGGSPPSSTIPSKIS